MMLSSGLGDGWEREASGCESIVESVPRVFPDPRPNLPGMFGGPTKVIPILAYLLHDYYCSRMACYGT